ncbi:MAG: hypothetical protein JW772_02885 [Candidatus Diapherotrites archaeon]|nr:hypothetical protein [Candidatus Diapherotrites archaeon]
MLLFLKSLFNKSFVSPFAKIQHNNNIVIGKKCLISRGCYFRIPKTSKLVIGDNCAFLPYSQVICRENTETVFGKNCFVGSFSFISGQASFGDNVIVSPHSCVFGGLHNFKTLKKPVNQQGSAVKPVKIGSDVWLGAHSVVLGNAEIGDQSILGAGIVFKGKLGNKKIVRQKTGYLVEDRKEKP